MEPIIIEGPDGAGKTTLIDELIKMCDYNVIKMTAKGNQTIQNYLQKLNCDNVFIDRCWISEQIYSKYFNREMRLANESCELLTDLCDKKGIKIVFLLPKLDVIKSRLGIRGDEYEDIVGGSNTVNIYNDYVEYAKQHTEIKVCECDKLEDEIDFFKDLFLEKVLVEKREEL